MEALVAQARAFAIEMHDRFGHVRASGEPTGDTRNAS
jgi:hypothetical protein